MEDIIIIPTEQLHLDNRLIRDALARYDDLCAHQMIVSGLKFGKEEKDAGTDVTDVITNEPLTRIITHEDNPIISETDRVLCLYMVDGRICGLIGGILNADSIRQHPGAPEFDQYKYGLVDGPLAWLEILCISPQCRGKGVGKILIDTFISIVSNYRASHDPGEISGSVGLDIIGTLNGYTNDNLRQFYERHDFTFLHVCEAAKLFNGAQFGIRKLGRLRHRNDFTQNIYGNGINGINGTGNNSTNINGTGINSTNTHHRMERDRGNTLTSNSALQEGAWHSSERQNVFLGEIGSNGTGCTTVAVR